ncbi:MAG: hypothetical protein ACRCTE_09050, partial [Cellulosilyticaceae bacterium]
MNSDYLEKQVYVKDIQPIAIFEQVQKLEKDCFMMEKLGMQGSEREIIIGIGLLHQIQIDGGKEAFSQLKKIGIPGQGVAMGYVGYEREICLMICKDYMIIRPESGRITLQCVGANDTRLAELEQFIDVG